MSVLLVIAVIATALAVLGFLEAWVHRGNLESIRYRIHVNGTRGKSSVTRLIAAGLREGGVITCAKTTGATARMILPDGREVPVFRPAGANVIEQIRIVATAAAHDAEALVIECMALHPELQSLSELKMIRATHGVITNARPDHLDIMGPRGIDVARALAGTVPVGGVVYTAEREHQAVFEAAARDRRSKLVAITQAHVDGIHDEDLAGFHYTEHGENVAIALEVCQDLGVDRTTALRGMWKAEPDPGAMTAHQLDYFGRDITFVNGFAANDPVSTERTWNLAVAHHPDVERKIAVFNCRSDRPDRSIHLGRSFASWGEADHVVLMGTGTYLFARAATKAGIDTSKLVFAEGLLVNEIFEKIVGLVGGSALVMGMGNTGGHGLDLVRFFANRSTLEAVG